jgi:hypothetical protein
MLNDNCGKILQHRYLFNASRTVPRQQTPLGLHDTYGEKLFDNDMDLNLYRPNENFLGSINLLPYVTTPKIKEL